MLTSAAEFRELGLKAAGVDEEERGALGCDTRCAAMTVNSALLAIADKGERAAAYSEAVAASKRAVTRIRCPVDVAGLRALARTAPTRSPCGPQPGVPVGAEAQRRAGSSTFYAAQGPMDPGGTRGTRSTPVANSNQVADLSG